MSIQDLPNETLYQIFDLHRPDPSLALVCKRWQPIVDSYTFQTVCICSKSLDIMNRVLSPVRRTYVRLIQLEFSCFPRKDGPVETHKSSKEVFKEHIGSFLTQLSKWDPDSIYYKGIDVEIDGFPSDEEEQWLVTNDHSSFPDVSFIKSLSARRERCRSVMQGFCGYALACHLPRLECLEILWARYDDFYPWMFTRNIPNDYFYHLKLALEDLEAKVENLKTLNIALRVDERSPHNDDINYILRKLLRKTTSSYKLSTSGQQFIHGFRIREDESEPQSWSSVESVTISHRSQLDRGKAERFFTAMSNIGRRLPQLKKLTVTVYDAAWTDLRGGLDYYRRLEITLTWSRCPDDPQASTLECFVHKDYGSVDQVVTSNVIESWRKMALEGHGCQMTKLRAKCNYKYCPGGSLGCYYVYPR